MFIVIIVYSVIKIQFLIIVNLYVFRVCVYIEIVIDVDFRIFAILIITKHITFKILVYNLIEKNV